MALKDTNDKLQRTHVVRSFKTLLLTALMISATTAPIYCETEIATSTEKKSKVYMTHGSRKYAHLFALLYAGLSTASGIAFVIGASNDLPQIAIPTALLSVVFGGLCIHTELSQYFNYYEIEIPKDIVLTVNIVNQN